MKNPELFKAFAKSSKSAMTQRGSKALIYTRVSSQGQVNNFSLQVQKEKCEACAKALGLEVVQYFGGTHESAKTDDRKEFNALINFSKDRSNEVGYILVYQLDRFSRSGDHSISILEDLKKYGVTVFDSNTTSLTEDSSHTLVQSIKLVVAHEDNKTRKKKCTDGTLQRLNAGYWIGKPSKGYQKVDKYNLELTDEAKHIRMAFELKVKGYTNSAILVRINAHGSTITKSRLPHYLKNSFYCGYIASKHLEGEVVKGLHEPIVPEELFLLANKVGQDANQGYKTLSYNESRPLQGDLKCSCGGVYTGYIKKGVYHYYKCNKCKNNTSTSPMHKLFEEHLLKYNFEEKYLTLVQKQLRYTFDYISKDTNAAITSLKSQLSKRRNELEKVDMRFALEALSADIHSKVSATLNGYIVLLEEQVEEMAVKLSNYNFYEDNTLEIVSNIGHVWTVSDYHTKKDIQNLLFSNHIEYNHEEHIYRTPKVNSVFSMIVESLEQKETGQTDSKANLSRLVPWAGIEPALSKELDFESSASTSSATKAYIVKILQK